MKKTIYLATLVLSFGLFGSFLGGSVAFADKQEPMGISHIHQILRDISILTLKVIL